MNYFNGIRAARGGQPDAVQRPGQPGYTVVNV
jgi:hypothetical protein